MYSIKKEVFNSVWTVKTIRVWDADSIRDMCIRNNFYTCGSNEDYEKLMTYVTEHSPTTPAMFWVARDIFLHSKIEDERTAQERLGYILFCLELGAITTNFEVYAGWKDDN